MSSHAKKARIEESEDAECGPVPLALVVSEGEVARRARAVVEQGWRFVIPYYYEHFSHAKKRWFGRTVLETYTSEFRHQPVAYWEHAQRASRLLLNGKKVPADALIKDGDVVCHIVHRHEPAAFTGGLQVIADTSNHVVVNKPGSMPIHPCGRYNANSLLLVLEAEFGLEGLKVVHRLDRLTSGIVMFARDKQSANRMREKFQKHLLQKHYVARVMGRFPEESVTESTPLSVAKVHQYTYPDPEHGRAAKTEFTRLWTDGNESIVLCRPLTGRTHQIRVHLKILGHAIVNDPLYVPGAPFPTRHEDDPEGENIVCGAPDGPPALSSGKYGAAYECPPPPRDAASFVADAICPHCPRVLPENPRDSSQFIFLHALRYSSDEWDYVTPLPPWATEAKRELVALDPRYEWKGGSGAENGGSAIAV